MWLVAVTALLCLPLLGLIVFMGLLMAAGPQPGSESDF